ncbi:CUB and sushi domain-containing protein 2-like [Oppia nitens]|uniref:CUB and sushi domain-containing protein 2-like n=1 Tax=Oppia nitens TaxID=1686743 RepID=UPI0023DBA8E1|nr:CUB and sushi domain-containing protein 2-like [Oppia nitens]
MIYAISDSQKCTYNLTDDHGTILSPNYPQKYPSHTLCQWYITVPRGQYALVKFRTFNTEALHDYLTVYDGHWPRPDRLLANYSGLGEDYDFIDGPPRNNLLKINSIIGTGNKLLVKFQSDYVLDSYGFNITYETINQGCGLTMDEISGVLHTPGYPDHYPFALKCNWNITVQPGKCIMIEFTDFDTEINYDHLVIHDGFDWNSSYITYTGNKVPPTVIFVTNHIQLKFSSDHNKPGRGFRLTYQAIDLSTMFENEISEALQYNDNTIDNNNNTRVKLDPFVWISLTLNGLLIIIIIVLVHRSRARYNSLANNILKSHMTNINKYECMVNDDDDDVDNGNASNANNANNRDSMTVNTINYSSNNNNNNNINNFNDDINGDDNNHYHNQYNNDTNVLLHI